MVVNYCMIRIPKTLFLIQSAFSYHFQVIDEELDGTQAALTLRRHSCGTQAALGRHPGGTQAALRRH